MEINNLELNGQVLEFSDEGAIRHDEVQTLPPEKQAQACRNIGAESVQNRVTTIDVNADDEHYPTAKAVYDQVAKQGFVRLAETVLTEDANEIMWTQGENGEKLSDYKDFFIHWVGKFDAEVSNEAWICRANNGSMYYCYTFLKKITTRQGFWWHIEELLSDNGYTTWKTTFPNAMVGHYKTDFDYLNQGLTGAAQQLKGDLTCSPHKIEHLRFGSLDTGAKMVAGSKAVLYGRKR